MAFDTELLAERIMDMLAISKGQVIWIWASTYSEELIDALAYRIRAKGAFWTLRFTSEKLLKRIGQNASEEYLPIIPNHELRWLKDVNAIIEVRDHSGHIPGVSLIRRRAMATEWIALIDEAQKQGCRRIKVLNPTPALATAYAMELETLNRLYLQAISVDFSMLRTWQNRVNECLSKSAHIHITSDLGTDLHLSIGKRLVLQDRDDLPCGEVYVAPHENSANGILVIDRLFVKGKPIEKLHLTFVNGKVTQIEGATTLDSETLKELLSASSGDKDVIAEFAIGLNPGVAEPIGNILFDEKIGGSIHVAIGMNSHFGGNNKSDLHLDMVVQYPKVWVDDELILENRLLRIGNKCLQFS
jgi:aminopeptidase